MAQYKHCQIHLTEPSLSEAYSARHKQAVARIIAAGGQNPNRVANEELKDFHGPHFFNVKSAILHDHGGVTVTTQDGAVYYYPVHTIARMKYYTTEE